MSIAPHDRRCRSFLESMASPPTAPAVSTPRSRRSPGARRAREDSGGILTTSAAQLRHAASRMAGRMPVPMLKRTRARRDSHPSIGGRRSIGRRISQKASQWRNCNGMRSTSARWTPPAPRRGCRREGRQRPPRHRDEPRPRRLSALSEGHAPRPDATRLARPRPLRALGRPLSLRSTSSSTSAATASSSTTSRRCARGVR